MPTSNTDTDTSAAPIEADTTGPEWDRGPLQPLIEGGEPLIIPAAMLRAIAATGGTITVSIQQHTAAPGVDEHLQRIEAEVAELGRAATLRQIELLADFAGLTAQVHTIDARAAAIEESLAVCGHVDWWDNRCHSSRLDGVSGRCGVEDCPHRPAPESPSAATS